MSLLPQSVPVQFRGLDTKTDDRWAVPGDLRVAKNVIFDNWPKLRKRSGYTALAQATAGALLAPFKSQLLLGTGREAHSLATGSGTLVDKGVLESLSVSALPVRRDAYAQTTPDSATHPLGVTVYTWESSSGGAKYAVFDTATGQPIVSGASLGATAVKPKPLVLGSSVIILYYDTALNHLRYVAVPAATPASPAAAVDFAIDPATSQVFDATVIGGQWGSLFVAYANNGASNTISLRALTSGLVLGPEVIPTTTEAFSVCCAIFGDASENVWVAYYTGSAVKVVVYDFALAAQRLAWTSVDAAPGTVRNVTGIAPPGQPATILYEATGSASYNNLIRTATVTVAGAVSGVGVLVRSVGLAGKPFYYLGRVHVLAAFQSALQSTYFLLSGQTVVAKLAPGVGGGLTAKSILPEANSPATGVYSTAYLQADQLSSSGGNVFTQAGVMAATFDFTQPQTAVELSDNLHLAGGIVSMYDGSAIVEHGFHVYPENVAATPSGSGGLILAGAYQYVATWEWMDAYGLLHQSSPSPAVSVTTSGSTSSVALTVPTLRLTAKANPVSVVIWRTQANQAVFYRLTSISSPLLNSTAADTVAFTDTAADAAIGGNAQLVFNPLNPDAELPPLAAPALVHVWRYRNRIAAIPAENPYQWIFSKAFVPGVPIEFNDQQLYQPVSQDGGPLTAGIEMDQWCVLFSATRIYCVSGDGPAPNGSAPDYGSSPQQIPSDVGCANRRSLVLTPEGVMFQAAGGKGIYLLGRDLSVRYLGAQVEAFNGLTITGARLTPNARRVVFSTSTGTALVWDYYAQRWAVWTNHYAADLSVFQGLLVHLQPAGYLMQETPGRFLDNGAPIAVSATSTWLSFAGLSGYQRAYRLIVSGDYRSAHRLTVSVAVDGNPVPVQSASADMGALFGSGAIADTTLADSDNPGGGPFPLYAVQVKLTKQKCSSVQVAIEEMQAGPTYGEGLALHGISFLVGVKRGLQKVAAASTISGIPAAAPVIASDTDLGTGFDMPL